MDYIIRIPTGVIVLILLGIMIIFGIIGQAIYAVVKLIVEYKTNKRKGK